MGEDVVVAVEDKPVHEGHRRVVGAVVGALVVVVAGPGERRGAMASGCSTVDDGLGAARGDQAHEVDHDGGPFGLVGAQVFGVDLHVNDVAGHDADGALQAHALGFSAVGAVVAAEPGGNLGGAIGRVVEEVALDEDGFIQV